MTNDQYALTLKTFTYRDAQKYMSAAALEMAVKLETDRLQAENPDHLVYWEQLVDPWQVRIRAIPRDPFHVPVAEDETLDVPINTRIPKGMIVALVATVGVMMAFCQAQQEQTDPLPPGVLYVVESPNGCVYETKRIADVKWVIPRKNAPYYDGLCASARIVE